MSLQISGMYRIGGGITATLAATSTHRFPEKGKGSRGGRHDLEQCLLHGTYNNLAPGLVCLLSNYNFNVRSSSYRTRSFYARRAGRPLGSSNQGHPEKVLVTASKEGVTRPQSKQADRFVCFCFVYTPAIIVFPLALPFGTSEGAVILSFSHPCDEARTQLFHVSSYP